MSEQGPPEETPGRPRAGRRKSLLAREALHGPVVWLGRDQLVQTLSAAVCWLLGVLVGALTAPDARAGALIGGFLGTQAGFFGSGLGLLTYCAVRYVQGLLRER